MIILICEFLILLTTLTLSIALVANAAVLISIVSFIFTAALAVPGIKIWLKNELPRIEAKTCSDLSGTLADLKYHKIGHKLLESAANKSKIVTFYELNSSGRLQNSITSQEISVSELPELGKSGEFPILFIDADKSTRNFEINSPGPIIIFNKNQDVSMNPSLRSASFIMACNEKQNTKNWTLQAPLIVSPRVDRLSGEARIVDPENGKTQIVEFSKLHEQVRLMIGRFINGEPPLSDDDIKEARARVLVGDRVSEQRPTVSDEKSDVQRPPESLTLSASKELRDQERPNQGFKQIAWEKTDCSWGIFYVHCGLTLNSADLQSGIEDVFKKKGGEIVTEKKYGPLTLIFHVKNPRIYFVNRKPLVKVDIRVVNKTAIPGQQEVNWDKTLQPSDDESMPGKLKQLKDFGSTVAKTVQNSKRSAAMILPREIEIKDAAMSGDVRYLDGQFYLDQAQLLDFDPDLPPNAKAFFEKFKPFLLSTSTEMARAHFSKNPVKDLRQLRFYGLPIAWYVFRSLNVIDDGVELKFKAGWKLF